MVYFFVSRSGPDLPHDILAQIGDLAKNSISHR